MLPVCAYRAFFTPGVSRAKFGRFERLLRAVAAQAVLLLVGAAFDAPPSPHTVDAGHV